MLRHCLAEAIRLMVLSIQDPVLRPKFRRLDASWRYASLISALPSIWPRTASFGPIPSWRDADRCRCAPRSELSEARWANRPALAGKTGHRAQGDKRRDRMAARRIKVLRRRKPRSAIWAGTAAASAPPAKRPSRLRHCDPHAAGPHHL